MYVCIYVCMYVYVIHLGALGQNCRMGATNWDCCKPSRQCGLGEGDCDSDLDCKAGLKCGGDNCRPYNPKGKLKENVCIPAYVCMCISVCLYLYMSVCPSVYVFVMTHICVYTYI